MCGAEKEDACIFTGTGSTSAINLMVHKLRLHEICDQIKQGNVKEVTQDEIEELAAKENFCEPNRWESFTCNLCKVILPNLDAYEKHAEQEIHKHNIEGWKDKYTVHTEMPVVIHSIFEHNANLIPWRETGAKMELV